MKTHLNLDGESGRSKRIKYERKDGKLKKKINKDKKARYHK
jgi:hypothetical protein